MYQHVLSVAAEFLISNSHQYHILPSFKSSCYFDEDNNKYIFKIMISWIVALLTFLLTSFYFINCLFLSLADLLQFAILLFICKSFNKLFKEKGAQLHLLSRTTTLFVGCGRLRGGSSWGERMKIWTDLWQSGSKVEKVEEEEPKGLIIKGTE